MREWAQTEKCRIKIRKPASLVVLVPILFMSINVVLNLWKMDPLERASPDSLFDPGRRKLLSEKENCTEPAVLDFPHISIPGGKVGQLILPFIASIYLYILLARVCDAYFIASIKVICAKIGFSGDVAGATLMAAATSSPELFVNLVGTFITKGNIGVGTIIGSAVFNILAVPGLCSFFSTTKAINLDYWPLIRDSTAYTVSLLILCFALRDGVIHWYEALFMVISYTIYIVMMTYNNIIRTKFEIYFKKFSNKNSLWEDPATWPLLNPKQANGSTPNGHIVEEIPQVHDHDMDQVYGWPSDSGIISKIWWLFTWPITFVLACTIPNSRIWTELYLLTFVMCVCWIGIGSYFISWMITISGYVLKIPDSVMGLTFIAAGMCIPETISSIIVTNQGQGSMALANALGSNVFDTLFCFGLPWLVKTVYFSDNADQGHYIEVNASGLVYDSLILLITLGILFAITATNNFKLTKIGGYSCILMYFIFIGFSVLIELYFHYNSNTSPTCVIDLN